MVSHGREETAGGSATASVRRGISWGAAPATEDTDTLVLTAPSGVFVDLRYPKLSTLTSLATPASHVSYWVFSGTAFNSDYSAAGHDTDGTEDTSDASASTITMPHVTHTRFVHAIDNRAPPGSGPGSVQDAGDSMALPNGDHIEWGVMPNPATGVSELYKEVWRAAPQGASAAQARVLRLQVKQGQQARGDALRIGDYFQGVLQRGGADGQVVAGRFTRTVVDGVTGWAWDPRSTTTALPAGWAADDDEEEQKIGAEVTVEGLVWEVVEVA
ncbi:uncharacterized protein BROUX77_002367 [Berkeleyomyces rouxiae]|uniref:uncharacterized protein n=1 Tax=Berkeleyomyces rouxiae TaxID=2035830 RepID=UPI003B79CEE7